ncbi:BLUF domain-containing protein [Mucilaginibacter galii]|uniref:BLUF domain-containing protein n=1 Tax=Mucilaginibacter galii TaxID=2005073 RepID=A0A917J5I5_9SPHI|nr:BLUF domain-containing protein [Mucilaginibacter galii]GGI48901.1 hypothetical protein GCM10011425_01130 [Mucilaginibacter galii]
MKYLVYISTAYRLLNQDELLDILAVSRKNNQRNNLTGMLLYGEGTFIQVLEGDADVLTKTYETIIADQRHKNIIKMAEGDIDTPNFPHWSMGFKSASAKELQELGGFTDPKSLGKNWIAAETSSILGMMKTFADANRMSD